MIESTEALLQRQLRESNTDPSPPKPAPYDLAKNYKGGAA